MKFSYQYRTKANELKFGTVCAADKDAAYALLRSQGVKPSRLEEAPGFWNKLLGKGKRWLAIGVLSLVSLVLGLWAWSVNREVEDRTLYEERGQIYGDPGVLREQFSKGWADVFASEGDRLLAAYAIPARTVAASVATQAELSVSLVPVSEKDLREIAQMKRMVNGMKRELRDYLRAGGTVAGYRRRLDIRQQAEKAIYDRARVELLRSDDEQAWKDRNGQLRAMGLPLVEIPENKK